MRGTGYILGRYLVGNCSMASR